MATNNRLDQLKSQIEKLGRDSVDVVASANRTVYQAIQKLAEQELKALNEYYKSAIASLKSARKGDSLKDLAATQIDLMQETVNRVITHARNSMSVIADARGELAKVVSRGEKQLSAKNIAKVAAPAKKAMKDVRAAAIKAKREASGQADAVRKAVVKEVKKVQKEASGQADAVRKAVVKEVKNAQKAGRVMVKDTKAKAEQVSRTVKQKVGSVLDITPPPAAPKKPVSAKPSPGSRASRATSMAKRALSRGQVAVKPV